MTILGGTGSLGGAMTKRWARAGHEIWIGSRDAAKAQAEAEVLKAEIAVLAVPYAPQVSRHRPAAVTNSRVR